MTTTRARRLAGPAACAAALGLGALALHLRDPHASGSWGACPSITWFGIACPLCGGLRATNDLSNGDLVAAFWSNALFVSALPLLALWWLSVVRDRWRGTTRRWNWPLDQPRVMRAVVVVAAVFTVVRNTPWGARLYP